MPADVSLRARLAEALREHYLDLNPGTGDVDGNCPCVCTEWREGGDEDWIEHQTDEAIRVVQAELDRRDTELATVREVNSQYRAMLEEARDLLESAGQRGAHGDDWPDVIPALTALIAERDAEEQRADAEGLTGAGIFHDYYGRWQSTVVEARRQHGRVDQVAQRGIAVIVAMGKDVREARAERHRYRSAWQSARRRAGKSGQHVEELQDKLLTFGVNGGCCCSYDNPGDICMVHSPTVQRLEAELAAAEETAADRQQNALHWQERAESAEARIVAARTAMAHAEGTDWWHSYPAEDIRFALNIAPDRAALGAAPTPVGEPDA
jgi:hypothetical protein